MERSCSVTEMRRTDYTVVITLSGNGSKSWRSEVLSSAGRGRSWVRPVLGEHRIGALLSLSAMALGQPMITTNGSLIKIKRLTQIFTRPVAITYTVLNIPDLSRDCPSQKVRQFWQYLPIPPLKKHYIYKSSHRQSALRSI